MRRFAEFISFLFHPVAFCMMLPFLVVYHQTESGNYALKWTIFSSVFIGFGVIALLIGRIRGSFSDMDLTRREERYKFYTFCLLLSFIFFLVTLFFKGIFSPLSIIAFGIILGIAVFSVVNHYTKASIHVGVAASFVLAVSVLYGPIVFAILVWIVPLVIWSRIYLKRHTISEAAIGGALGTLITLITLIIGARII